MMAVRLFVPRYLVFHSSCLQLAFCPGLGINRLEEFIGFNVLGQGLFVERPFVVLSPLVGLWVIDDGRKILNALTLQ